MTKERSTKIVYYITPGAGVLALGCGHISHTVKMGYVFKNYLLYSQAYIKQMVIMIKNGFSKNVTFMTPRAGVLALGRGHNSHIVKMYYFFKNLPLYSQE